MTSDPSAFFRDMLGQWEKMANQFGGEALKSQEFAQSMGTVGTATMAMQAAYQQAIERALIAANLPSRKDFDELAASVAKIQDTLFRIEQHLGSASTPTRPKPTRGRKSPTPKSK